MSTTIAQYGLRANGESGAYEVRDLTVFDLNGFHPRVGRIDRYHKCWTVQPINGEERTVDTITDGMRWLATPLRPQWKARLKEHLWVIRDLAIEIEADSMLALTRKATMDAWTLQVRAEAVINTTFAIHAGLR